MYPEIISVYKGNFKSNSVFSEIKSITTYKRVITVNSSTNNPLTLTGGYANNSAFIITNSNGLIISSSNSVLNAAGYKSPSGINEIYPISLTYVEASNNGEILILYN